MSYFMFGRRPHACCRAMLFVFALGLLTLTANNGVEAFEPIQNSQSETAKKILDETGVPGGFIAVVGVEDGQLAAALRVSDSYFVHAIDTDMKQVTAARAYIKGHEMYGQVSVDQFDGSRLLYIDNLINLLIVNEPGDLAKSEMLRVLAPNGIAYVKEGESWTKTVKPRPEDIDEWTHFMHDASGNAVAHDDVVGPPRHLQWVGSPRWSRHHDRMASMSALISAGGRMFYIMDEGSRQSIQLPSKWKVVARDAFNGTILWKRAFDNWQNHLWPLKSGPTQLTRRLVTDGKTLYVTLGLQAPLTSLDCATGELLQTYDGSASCEEVIESNGTLFLLVNKKPNQLEGYGPQHNVGDQARVRTEYTWNEVSRAIVAYDAKSGAKLWEKPTRVSPLSMCADDARVVFHDGSKVVCLDRETGEENWSSVPASRRKYITMNFGPKLVLYKGVALFAGGDKKMQSFDLKSGKELWSAPHGQSGYQSPEDLLVSNGLVWSAPTTSGKDSGIFTGRDPVTGEVKIEFPPDVETYWFHHRCYISKATDNFLMPSRTGIEFVDPSTEHWDINHWVRGGCLYGVMPCNGLVYTPPHNCFCYPEAKLFGFNSLAPSTQSRIDASVTSEEGRLLKGPAYGAADAKLKFTDDGQEWPTFRHDNGRSGFTTTPVSKEVEESWKVDLGGELSAIVCQGGRLFVSQIDRHTMVALDESSGETVWTYTTGARVDSPPTISTFVDPEDASKKVELCVFGSSDGYVYCLRADNGQLVWRFRAAPSDQRLMAYEQLESVWPVSGSVMVENGFAYFVAGRSNFLDNGLKWFKLDVKTGEKIQEVGIDEIDPETGKPMQDKIATLQMPVGLPDILSADEDFIYMRSQRFDRNGTRSDIGPVSGNAAEQGAAQGGKGSHLFSPSGYLDGSYFHRSYWVFGRSFAGGHNGYHQAGKFAPAGRMLVFDDSSVYGFGRKAQYLKWTTTMEHQLFMTDKETPATKVQAPSTHPLVRFKGSSSLDPTKKEITVEAWVKPGGNSGVILAHGGPSRGYALTIAQGKPRFIIRRESEIYRVASDERIVGKWTHLAGVLSKSGQVKLFVNGKLAQTLAIPGLINGNPVQGLSIGADEQTSVGNYTAPFAYRGTIDDVRIYHAELSPEQIQLRSIKREVDTATLAKRVLALSFDRGNPRDTSGNKNHGELIGGEFVASPTTTTKVAAKQQSVALLLSATNLQPKNENTEGGWHQDVPLMVTAMVKTGDVIFAAGPPDLMDEETTFQSLVLGDPRVNETLQQQDEAWLGKRGAVLRAVDAVNGETIAEYRLGALPVWDGLISSGGNLYVATTDGRVIRYTGSKNKSTQ